MTNPLPQGDLRLLDSPVAQRLLQAAIPASLGYAGPDGLPRVVPMNTIWVDGELVMGAFAGTYKISALRTRPDVAVSVDTADGGAAALLLRGRVTLAEVDGVLPEYALAQRKGAGAGADAYLAAIDVPGLRMVRIGLRPTWVGLLDFAERIPDRTPAPVRSALQASS